MRREDLADLSAFMAVAEERSYTRAAAKLGTSQSALSHTVRLHPKITALTGSVFISPGWIV